MRVPRGHVLVGVAAVTGVAAVAVAWFFKLRRRPAVRIVELMKEISKPHVHILNRSDVEEKLRKLIEGAHERLQLIVDFDRTLTKYKHEGKLVPTCHNVLETSNLVPAFYAEQTKKFLETYYPIEIDPHMTVAEKTPYMVEWWTKAHKLMTQIGLHRDTFTLVVRQAKITLRDRCQDLFVMCHKNDVPLLIFSAGLGDVIEETIRLQSQLYNNIKIVSNYMDFNHGGVMVGFKGELIHTFNKNENAIHNSTYFEELKHRDNVILLGDSTGDPRMAEGVEDDATVLKIGFLNVKVEEQLELYKRTYDIVIVSDETMNIPIAILKQVL